MTAAPADLLYFGYGSNLSEERLRKSCPSARLMTTGRLDGYRLAFTRRSERWGGGVADIREEPGSEVWGAVWRISGAEAAALDRQEGVDASPPHYQRIEVTVTTREGGQLDCLAYQVATREAEHVAPSEAYLETMLEGARALDLPVDYVEHLTEIEAAS